MQRSPEEVVLRYNHEFWSERKFDLADELISEEVIRHEVGKVETLTRAESRQRAIDFMAEMDDARFDLLHTVSDGEFVTIVYVCTLVPKEAEKQEVSSIEVFRVVDGRICEVWNAAYEAGRWR
ncbi:ester cyclase [Rhodococcus sp. NPDC056960]|uniref:ester cyclase n=1 Tax=Rhodococcus sp. NPDC056960 TaxID=3345982 RepID=UPI0036371B5E